MKLLPRRSISSKSGSCSLSARHSCSWIEMSWTWRDGSFSIFCTCFLLHSGLRCFYLLPFLSWCEATARTTLAARWSVTSEASTTCMHDNNWKWHSFAKGSNDFILYCRAASYRKSLQKDIYLEQFSLQQQANGASYQHNLKTLPVNLHDRIMFTNLIAWLVYLIVMTLLSHIYDRLQPVVIVIVTFWL